MGKEGCKRRSFLQRNSYSDGAIFMYQLFRLKYQCKVKILLILLLNYVIRFIIIQNSALK